MTMETVSKWLGHSSISQTEKAYAFLETHHLHEAAGTKIEPLWTPRETAQKWAQNKT